ncbi:BTAD domain-containing putative transcriptional regulator [Actinocrispum sp. NPDC049592]|uniref:ATP-binding protein n=1 Tax=Actinocrispum sp. NPDC049592 TaxID=3154835 RepID=UPI00342E27CB
MTIELTLLTGVACQGKDVTAPRLRNLLALLADDLRRGCGTTGLIDGLWPDDQPENPAKALQILVSRARSQLGADLIANTSTGYRLNLTDEQVDSSAVLRKASTMAGHARSGDHAASLADAEAGLRLFEGAQASDGSHPLDVLRASRAATRDALTRGRAMALSRLGRHSEAVGSLADLVRDRPRDEELLLELLRSEAATSGPSAALSRYDAYRQALRGELGADPGAGLQALHQSLLRADAPVVRHGVEHEPNPLLGRDDDITAVAGLLRTSRVATIVGPGGLGKTRLAHAVGRDAEQRIVHFVPLAGVSRDEDVIGEVAFALGTGEARKLVRPAPQQDLLGRIVKVIGSGPVLLVLDNCEHVIQGVAELTRALVSVTKDLRILATSRTPLGVSSESVYPLPELTLATTIQLFEERARAVRPDVELPRDVLEDLCGHLDGLPLAAELAAARVRVMSVREVAQRLDDRFSLLRGGSRDAPQRHRTLHAVVDWSWNLLDDDGQQALRVLSIFPGGFTAEAAQHVLNDENALETVEHLVDQSLLKVTETPLGTRFGMLETVREFGAAQRKDTEQVVSAFVAWARAFGLAHYDDVYGPDGFRGLARIQHEQDNLQPALRYALRRGDHPTVAAIGATLAGLFLVTGNYSRMTVLNDDTSAALARFQPDDEFVEPTRAVAVLCMATIFMMQRPRPVRWLITLRRLPSAPPDTLIRAVEVVLTARPEEIVRLCDSDQPLVAGVANGLTSYFWEQQRDIPKAVAATERMVAIAAGSPWLQVVAHSRCVELYMQLEAAERIRDHALAALDILGPWPDPIGLVPGLVVVNMLLGEVDEAERQLRRAEAAPPDDTVATQSFLMGARAEILLARGETEAGLRTWRLAADRLRHGARSPYEFQPAELDPWLLEIQSATVVAHARAGQLHLVEDIAAELPGKLSTLVTADRSTLPTYVMEFPVCGAVLLALSFVELDAGARTSAARMIALANRFRFNRAFQPTMASHSAIAAAENADKAAYDEAVSSYAALDENGLRAAALAALHGSTQWQGFDAAHVG